MGKLDQGSMLWMVVVKHAGHHRARSVLSVAVTVLSDPLRGMEWLEQLLC